MKSKNRRQQGIKNNPSAQNQGLRNNPAPAAAPAPSEEMIIQFGENEVTAGAVSEKVKQDYKEKGLEGELKDIKIYVKPEDNKAYYVVNGETEGSVDLV